MTKVEFYDPSFTPVIKLTYSVIAAKFKHQWLYVRHNKRTTWEIPAGHIETGETPPETASRELKEETGAVDFSIDCVATYSVLKNGEKGYGRLFVAEIFKLGPIPAQSEIAEIKMLPSLPETLTHPDIQPQLFEKILDYLKNNQKQGT